MAATSFLRIPGNIKQSALPFVLSPGKEINSLVAASSDLEGKKPQFFSFRPSQSKVESAGFGQLNICPSTLSNMTSDIANQLLYSPIENKIKKSTTVNVNAILDNIPGIQIREFLPDTRLDQALNFFGDIMKSAKSLWSDDKDKKKAETDQLATSAAKKAKEEKDTADLFRKIGDAATWTMKYMTGIGDENLFTTIKTSMDSSSPVSETSYKKMELDRKTYVINFPYILYYRFQSCVTTNVYELPCIRSGNMLYSSNGNEGWGEGGKLEIVNSTLAGIPILGPLLKSILGNVRVHFMPWWDSDSGSTVTEPEVQVTFDLFNDTFDAAMMNFIFVNTLVANNKWVQYNVFQHSSSLYDVKIEGCNRLFACSGKFDVTYKGVLREPSKQFIDTLCTKYGNSAVLDVNALKDECVKNKLIKIPDIYTVSMTFTSIIPANFNTFLFQYACNQTIHKKIGYESSVVPDIMTKAMKDFTDRLKLHWENDDWEVPIKGDAGAAAKALDDKKAAEAAAKQAQIDAEEAEKQAEKQQKEAEKKQKEAEQKAKANKKA